MKMIILAAGEGTRLKPLTDNQPKCMVPYRGKPIIDHILETARACGLTDIVLVKGYRADALERAGTRACLNAEYASTNMVYTLFCAEHELNDDVIISYADIVYTPANLRTLMSAAGDFAVLVDLAWRRLWTARMEDPLQDAETMKIDVEGRILELGKKPSSYEDVQAQYMGLIKISAAALPAVRCFYHELDAHALYDGRSFEKMYMTSFIQLVIDKLMPVAAVPVRGGWVEIDSVSDLACPFEG